VTKQPPDERGERVWDILNGFGVWPWKYINITDNCSKIGAVLGTITAFLRARRGYLPNTDGKGKATLHSRACVAHYPPRETGAENVTANELIVLQ
jgi:hypothetical protein